MVASKTELFDELHQEQARMFRALAHPARLQILHFLAETKSCFSGDLSEVLPLGRTTVNQHLAELKSAGLIQGHISGSKTNYCLNYTQMEKMKQLLSGFAEGFTIPENFSCNSR